MGKVIGLGGVFIKFKDPARMKDWYEQVLGITTNDYGVLFSFNHTSGAKGYLQLGTFPENTDYFGKEQQQCMLNFRVEGLNDLVSELKNKGVNVLDAIETYPYGSFVHIEDPEGNRIELWEPIDSAFNKEREMPMK